MTAAQPRRIVLHVGSPKCGSTFLQQVMLRNAPALRAQGVLYPHDGGAHPGNAGHLVAIDRPTIEGYFADGVHTVVLSHEDLFSTAQHSEPLARVTRADRIPVQIVAFLRPFSGFVFSDYSQFMKQFFEEYLQTRDPYEGQSFEEFALRRLSMKPADYLRDWKRVFREIPMILASHTDIKAVFNGLLGPAVQMDWTLPRQLANPSLPIADCERIVQAMRNRDVPAKTIRAMMSEAFENAAGDDAGRTTARINLIETAFKAQNQDLLEMHGYDNRLPGYPLDTP